MLTDTVADKPEVVVDQASSSPDIVLPEFSPDTLLGDALGFIVDEFRQAPGLYLEMPGWQQKQIRDRIQVRLRHVLEETARVLAAKGNETIEVEVGDFKTKGDVLKCDFACTATDDNLLGLRHADKAVLVLTDLARYSGGVSDADRKEGASDPQADMFDGQAAGAGEKPSDEGLSPDQFEAGLNAANAAAEKRRAGDKHRLTIDPDAPAPEWKRIKGVWHFAETKVRSVGKGGDRVWRAEFPGGDVFQRFELDEVKTYVETRYASAVESEEEAAPDMPAAEEAPADED